MKKSSFPKSPPTQKEIAVRAGEEYQNAQRHFNTNAPQHKRKSSLFTATCAMCQECANTNSADILAELIGDNYTDAVITSFASIYKMQRYEAKEFLDFFAVALNEKIFFTDFIINYTFKYNQPDTSFLFKVKGSLCELSRNLDGELVLIIGGVKFTEMVSFSLSSVLISNFKS